MPSPFETALSKLASLLGDDTPEATAYGVKNALAGYPGVGKVENALNPDPQVTNRASMLPIGNYDDGSVGPAWPQSAVDAGNALMRFQRGEAPQPQDAVLAGLAMAGSGFGGLGARAVESGAARFAANPKEAAPAGLLATSNLDRMKAAESAPARSIPDAPQSIPELQGMIDSNLDRFAVSRSVGDQAFSQDPARYNAYAYGLHDVMNPDSEWAMSSPTLQSGGSAAPAAVSSSEHHSRAQPRGEGGRFVAKDSFDGRLAALDKMLVDLDGDGLPDVAVQQQAGNALRRMNPEVWPSDIHVQQTIDDIHREVPLPPAWDEIPSPIPIPWRG
ncbi:protein of unknown function [Hyphomicrobium sp. 1Nfss2.1]|uniref:hypothetical protein n=1 Tax=Hyphomicrobium sp. 1Nfss2.1 TaxID=3413936 RepID=UPI003C7A19C9